MSTNTEVIDIGGTKAELLDRLEDILAGMQLAQAMLLRSGTTAVVARAALLEEIEHLRSTINYVASNIADDV